MFYLRPVCPATLTIRSFTPGQRDLPGRVQPYKAGSSVGTVGNPLGHSCTCGGGGPWHWHGQVGPLPHPASAVTLHYRRACLRQNHTPQSTITHIHQQVQKINAPLYGMCLIFMSVAVEYGGGITLFSVCVYKWACDSAWGTAEGDSAEGDSA